jgi:Glycosyl hydrolases family 15
MQELDHWIERQYRHSVVAMLQSFSAVGVVKHRPGFGQTVTPKKGSIVASPVLAAYDPDPDYFFHWFRDSAVVIEAVWLLLADGMLTPAVAVGYFRDFVQFSLSLLELDGRARVASPAWRAGVQPDFARFIRTDEDLGAVHGELVSAEARVNPDGTLDISNWARPQHDGPPLRSLAVLRWIRDVALDSDLAGAAAQLLRADLAFTRNRWRIPSVDIWEEERGHHYYTLRVSAEALAEGARWLNSQGDMDEARQCHADAQAIMQILDGYWLADEGYYRSRVLEGGARSMKELDIAVIFAAIHTTSNQPRHSVYDPRMQATLARLEALFDAEYAINHGRSAGRGPAIGRYKGDVYYSGGAYYFSTLAAAEFCFRAAVGQPDGQGFLERGDAYLETVRAFTPPTGDLSEQFDQKTGAQTSARHLAWSYAALISSVIARRDALRSLVPHR